MGEVELRRIETASDWRACHDIRRAVLYEARGRLDYDEDHPDNLVPTNHTLGFVIEGIVTGVSRLDFHDGHAVLRAVAIAAPSQRKGYGKAMMERVQTYALDRGVTVLFVNSAPDATGFYQKLGYVLAPPNEEPGNPRMMKGLTTS